MAITSLDGVIAGSQPNRSFLKGLTGAMVAGRPISLFPIAGVPGAAAASVAGINGEALTSYPGQLDFVNPVVPGAKTYLARLTAQATVPGILLLCDRLWHNSGLSVTSTSLQAITSPAFPARDVDGTINGNKVQLGVEVVSALGAGTPTITCGYANEAGVTGRLGVNVNAVVASSALGTFYPIGLQVGDKGVKAVESFQLSATMTSGAISLVAYRVIASLPISQGNTGVAIDALTSGFPELFNNSVPFFIFIPQTTTTSVVCGEFAVTQG